MLYSISISISLQSSSFHLVEVERISRSFHHEWDLSLSLSKKLSIKSITIRRILINRKKNFNFDLQAYGMHCKQSVYNSKLWHSMVKNERTQRWYPDVTFCYPRVGSFEVNVVKGKQRVKIFFI